MKKILSLIAISSLIACSGINSKEQLSEFVNIKGNLRSNPEMEDGFKRLFIYLNVEGKDKPVVILINNKNEEKIIEKLNAKLIAAKDYPVYISAIKIENRHEEILSGIEYQAIAVGVYIPEADDYRWILTTYDPSVREAMKDVSWTDLIKNIFSVTVRKAL